MTIDNKTLATCVKDWRQQRQVSVADAAKAFGMSKRTLEGIEQGRGVQYPKMFLIAMKVIGETEFNFFDRITTRDDTAADAGTGGQGTRDRHRHAERDATGWGDPVHQHRSRKKARDAEV